MKQVDKTHYDFVRYMSKARWNSVWHQIDEVLRLKPDRVLEIGPGPGVFKKMMQLCGVRVETLDLDPELAPDHIGLATAIPLADSSFDVVCAFQMLEHVPYEQSLKAFSEMARVSARHIVISLPDAKQVWRYSFYIPKLGAVNWFIPRPFSRPRRHTFDGEHYWELNKLGFSVEEILNDFEKIARQTKSYRVFENPYHRFFVFEKN
jgi:cyclopropane fatty-acyl-phospholipid synthase-like methyltransferase